MVFVLKRVGRFLFVCSFVRLDSGCIKNQTSFWIDTYGGFETLDGLLRIFPFGGFDQLPALHFLKIVGFLCDFLHLIFIKLRPWQGAHHPSRAMNETGWFLAGCRLLNNTKAD